MFFNFLQDNPFCDPKVFLKVGEDLSKNLENPFLKAESLLDALQKWSLEDVGNLDKASFLQGQNLFFELVSKFLTTQNPDTNRKIQFFLRQYKEALNPENFLLWNKDVLKKIEETGGESVLKGMMNWMEDIQNDHHPSTSQKDDFCVGEDLATTPGHVVFETPLFQLIHYKRGRCKKHANPLLIIPPWINRYYIFDLTKEKSFVKWCVDQKIDTYIISWKNPVSPSDNHDFDDYVNGVLTVQRFLNQPLNYLSFCIGGVATLIALTKTPKKNICSNTVLATPVDFSKMTELSTYICKDQIEVLREKSKTDPIFSGNGLYKMFCSLRSKEMYWNNVIKRYYLNEDIAPNPFLYWNSHFTNLPSKMHLTYLEHLFLKNGILNETYQFQGKPVHFKKLKNLNTFCLATKKDHIVPEEAAFALKKFCPNAHYVLGGAGHIAGVINPPKQKKYGYEVMGQGPCDGSWWPHWFEWVSPYLGDLKYVKSKHQFLEPAPGRYVFS